MDPVFISDFSDVFASFNQLMRIPETQLKKIHVVQVGVVCCYGDVYVISMATESDVGVFPGHSARTAADLHPPRDRVRIQILCPYSIPCLGSIPLVQDVCV